jgi:hypothetical protein
MTTSGTTAFHNSMDILEIVEEACERCGFEVRGGYDLKSARRSLDLLMREWGNRGLNMWTLDPRVVPYVINPDGLLLLDPDVIDVLDCAWRTEGTGVSDIMLTRFSGSQWMSMSNKQMPGGSPSQYFIERVIPQPKMHLWPIPSVGGTLILWCIRSIQDMGKYANTPDVSPRFLPALVSGLAYYMALKSPNAAPLIPVLQGEYERQFNLASEEDRERSSFFMTPDTSSYRR